MNIDKIRQFFAHPIFEDEEKTRSAELINTLLVSISLLFVFGLIGIASISNFRSVLIILLTAFILIMQGLRVPLKRGYVRAVSIIFVTTFTIVVISALSVSGTVRIPAVSMFILVSVIAGLTLGQQAAYISTVINIIAVSIMIWAEDNSLLPQMIEQSNLQQILGFILSSVLTVILLNQALRRIRVALELAKSKQIELSDLNRELEQQVADRTRALETSTDISRRLSTILDQQQLVREVVEQLQNSFGYYHVHIYLYDDAKRNLKMVGGTGDAGRTMLARGHKIEKGQGVVGRAADTNEVVLIPDVSQSEGWLPNPLLTETKAEVAVPIAIGPDVLGVLDVQHNVSDGLSEQDANLIQAIANQVAIAIQNSQAYTRAQRQAVREAQIAAINQRIQAATDVDEVLKIAISELGRTLGSKSSVELKVNASAEDGRSTFESNI